MKLETKIEFLKGVGPQKAALLIKELGIFTYSDLLQHYPYRYEDRTKFYSVSDLNADLPNVQIRGTISRVQTIGVGRKQRLVAIFKDQTGEIELVWFKGAQWIEKKLQSGIEYIIFGKPSLFGKKLNISHPDFEPAGTYKQPQGYLHPVYSVTESLRKRYLDSKGISKIMRVLVSQVIDEIPEILSTQLVNQFALIKRSEAVQQIHFPSDHDGLQKAQFRLKFEELFFIQLRMLKLKGLREEKFQGQIFNKADIITDFYKNHIPFELTGAQKNVVKEAYADMHSGHQMNRLLQGDVGSGKTIVAFLCMLLAINSDAQAAIMAPTEILAEQHFEGLRPFAEKMGLRIGLLTGSTKQSARKILHGYLKEGDLHILVGTHALLEDKVVFNNLGLAVIDEQHRFGVAQRSKLWAKNKTYMPHILVMTATPIPRTLAMTLYGDLDISVIDELPAGRKPIVTVHRFDSNRLRVIGFMKDQITEGRQVYVVYPLIEESEKSDLKDLMDGYESACRAFPNVPVSILHGKMKSVAKSYEMNRFVKGETKIMVATTVIEVGVNVPNASVMVIENSERFGLAQLHQLRGRVGRGADQSYCVLMSSFALSKEAKIRIDTMVRTNNGFEIADTDLRLRGPGDLMGTQQSGLPDLLISDLSKDAHILKLARQAANTILTEDPDLASSGNRILRRGLASKQAPIEWKRVS